MCIRDRSKSLWCNNTNVRRGECLAEDTAVIYIYRFVCQSIQTVITFLKDRDSNFMTDSCTLSRICINNNFTFINNCVKFILNLDVYKRQHSVFVMFDSLSFTDKFTLGVDDSADIKFTDHIDDTGSA